MQGTRVLVPYLFLELLAVWCSGTVTRWSQLPLPFYLYLRLVPTFIFGRTVGVWPIQYSTAELASYYFLRDTNTVVLQICFCSWA